ncbi:hypothetical protein [Paenibacillus sp. N3.4]|uniref:hypothetical protein n=1 Tax=Paenibacillus sp. N3.4 TaxID=2603222 RepID=UPI0011C9A016|nr:hypothetical protein [Paenibacillus sp. N3.4]TXK75464.1 hypothetical protein FU659_27300 [Paenibacillus sp. N3.4]
MTSFIAVLANRPRVTFKVKLGKGLLGTYGFSDQQHAQAIKGERVTALKDFLIVNDLVPHMYKKKSYFWLLWPFWPGYYPECNPVKKVAEPKADSAPIAFQALESTPPTASTPVNYNGFA